MWRKVTLVIMGLAVAGGLSACAGAGQYGISPGGPHFASWTHAKYSVRGGEKPALTQGELKQAKAEGWWGTPIRYTIDELE